MKKYIKLLFPFRWIFPLLFIICTSVIIDAGFQAEMVSQEPNKYFINPYMWFGGNFLFWIFIDYVFGLGQRNVLERNKPEDCHHCNNTGWTKAMQVGSFIEFTQCRQCDWYEYHKEK